MAVVILRGEDGASLLTPLLLAIPVILVMALSLALPRASMRAARGRPISVQPESPATNNWVANCSVRWMPECVEALSRARDAL